tara:strand:- start:372 stop:1178 length:807 start_codon:yes stop_codon:yes gene_type:complete
MNESKLSPDTDVNHKSDFSISGDSCNILPKDLYIPPDALEVILEVFSGPLDLLLYLIRKQNLNILDIPIADITKQYMKYIELMRQIKFDLAGEYLVMAATLAEIKSRMLLPKIDDDEDPEDPRAALVRRLQEYERFRIAAQGLDAMPRLDRDLYLAYARVYDPSKKKPQTQVELADLIKAMHRVMTLSERRRSLKITREVLSVRERMTRILGQVKTGEYIRLETFFSSDEGRMGLVVSFIAILELVSDGILKFNQNENLAPIYVKLAK